MDPNCWINLIGANIEYPMIFCKTKDHILMPEIRICSQEEETRNAIIGQEHLTQLNGCKDDGQNDSRNHDHRVEYYHCDESKSTTVTRVLTDDSGHSIKIRIASPPPRRQQHQQQHSNVEISYPDGSPAQNSTPMEQRDEQGVWPRAAGAEASFATRGPGAGRRDKRSANQRHQRDQEQQDGGAGDWQSTGERAGRRRASSR